MDQLIFASLSHNHYRYEVGMLKVPAVFKLFRMTSNQIRSLSCCSVKRRRLFITASNTSYMMWIKKKTWFLPHGFFHMVTMSFGTGAIVLLSRYHVLGASSDEFGAYHGVKFPAFSVTPLLAIGLKKIQKESPRK